MSKWYWNDFLISLLVSNFQRSVWSVQSISVACPWVSVSERRTSKLVHFEEKSWNWKKRKNVRKVVIMIINCIVKLKWKVTVMIKTILSTDNSAFKVRFYRFCFCVNFFSCSALSSPFIENTKSFKLLCTWKKPLCFFCLLHTYYLVKFLEASFWWDRE